MSNRKSLENAIDLWLNETQEGDTALDMYISDTLAVRMADAAWAVLDESRLTQNWLKREGHMKDD